MKDINRLKVLSALAAAPIIASPQPEVTAGAHTPIVLTEEAPGRKPDRSSCGKPAILRRHGTHLLPHQRGKFDLATAMSGSDNCPGTPIPSGTYTAAAPYTDSGNNMGANDTVSNSGCDPFGWYYSQSYGPDHIYSFTLTARGANPQIEVVGSGGYHPYIYILDGRSGSRCPANPGRTANNCRSASEWASQSSIATISPNGGMNSLPLNVPLHLFIDGGSGGGTSGGPYTLRIQDVTIAPSVTLPPVTPFDFDGDGKADSSVFRPSDGTWYLNRSQAGAAGSQWGQSGDKPVPADYDRDGKTDIAIFRPTTGRWYIISSFNSTILSEVWGLPTDIPVPGDFDNFGAAGAAIFRPSDGTWWLKYVYPQVVRFGQNGDIPVPGEYDGDGWADIGVFRPSTGTWFIANRFGGGIGQLRFGLSTDKPVPADYDGDGLTDIAVYRPSEGHWYIANSGSPTYPSYQFGLATDIPVPADYDGDGRADIAIFRPSDGTWWINRSTAGLVVIQWGQNGDRPIPAAYGN